MKYFLIPVLPVNTHHPSPHFLTCTPSNYAPDAIFFVFAPTAKSSLFTFPLFVYSLAFYFRWVHLHFVHICIVERMQCVGVANIFVERRRKGKVSAHKSGLPSIKT